MHKHKHKSMNKISIWMSSISIICTIVTILYSCASSDAQPRIIGLKTTEPIVHDPVLAKEDSTYYLFSTGNGITCLSSKDLKEWTFLGNCIDILPQWITTELPEARNHLWAPDIIYYKGLWHLYYACSVFGKNTSVIGHLTNKTLDSSSSRFKWNDCGMIVRSVPNRDNWNAIDPNIAIDENGTPWLSFGSFWGGIKLVKMSDDLNGLKQPEEWYNIAKRPRDTSFNDAAPEDGAIEAPFIFKKNKWYYLFVSFDYCCRGKESTYKVVVGRSQKIEGPYLDKNGECMENGGGSIVIEGDKINWQAVGHCAAYTIDGKDIFIAHAYDMEDGKPLLLVRNILWNDEWPEVNW